MKLNSVPEMTIYQGLNFHYKDKTDLSEYCQPYQRGHGQHPHLKMDIDGLKIHVYAKTVFI